MATVSDLHYKMSKKVAQLTKVIYHLNTKNDDHDSEMRALTEQYEAEIRDILNDAAAKVRFFKEKLEGRTTDERTEVALKELQKQHQKEKEDALRGFEQFKKTAKANEARIQQAAEQKVQALTQEMATLQAEFAQRVQQFEKFKVSLEDKMAKDLAAASAGKTVEVDNLVKTYNEKYKSMLAQQLAEREKEKAEMEAEFERKIKALQLEEERKLNAIRREAQQEKDKLQQELSSLMAAHTQQIAELQQQLDAALQEANRLKEVEATLNGRISDQMVQLEDREAKINDLQQQIAAIQQSMAASEEQNASLNDKVRALEDDLDKERQRALDALGKAGSDQQQLAIELAKLRAAQEKEMEARRRAEAEVTALKAETAQLTTKLTALEVENSRLKESAGRLEARIAQLQAGLQDASSTAGEERSRLLKQVTELQTALAAAHQETAAGHRALEDAKAAHRRAEDHLKAIHTAALQDQLEGLTTKWEKERKALEAEHAATVKTKNEAIAALESKLAGIMKQLAQLEDSSGRGTAELMAKVRQLETEKASMQKGFEEQLSQLEQRLEEQAAKFWKELRAKEEENTQLTDQIVVLKNDLGTSEAALKTSRAKEQQLVQQMAKEKAQWEAQLQAANDQHEAALAQLRARLGASAKDSLASELAAQRAELEAQFEMTKQRLEKEWAAMSKKEQDALEDSWAKRLQEMADKASKFQQHLQNAASQIASLEKQLKDLTDAHDQAKRLHSLEMASGVEKSEAEFKRKLAELEASLRNEFKAQEAEWKHGQDSAMQQLRSEHAKQLEALKQQKDAEKETLREQLLAQAQKDLVKAEETKDKQWGIVVAQVREEGQSELLKKEHAFQMELNRITGDVHGLKQAQKSLENELSGYKQQAEELQRKLTEATKELQKTQMSMREQAVEHERRLTEQEAQLREKHSRAMAHVVAENKQQTQQLKAEFDRVQQMMAANVQQLENKIQELERQYENRESREEDLVKINQLIGQVLEKESLIQKLQNQLKYYKLELENREENYNHMFKRQPNVMQGRPTIGPAAARAGSLATVAALPTPPNGSLTMPPIKKMAAKS